ncbi:S-adenosyl-L-homocysteine hydrolase [Microbacterium sp. AG1240]|nr:S-adenosyl-L-homocysteine hydrolase [Microbacterium sp. AG1240]
MPPLPRVLADAVAETWGATISVEADGADPLALPGFGAAFAQARADQVVRAFSRRTNLVLAGATTAVVGAGPIADALAAALTRIGSRVVRVSDDPVTRLRAHLAGIAFADVGALPETTRHAHYVVATGDGHDPIDPHRTEAVLIDASLGGTGLAPAGGPVRRPHVRRVGGASTVVDAPPPLPDDLNTIDALAWRLADLLVALGLLVAANGGDLTAADARLAHEVIA